MKFNTKRKLKHLSRPALYLVKEILRYISLASWKLYEFVDYPFTREKKTIVRIDIKR